MRIPESSLVVGLIVFILSTSLWSRVLDFFEGAPEQAIVAPSFAVWDAETSSYRVHARVWVFEPEPDSALRRAVIERLRDGLDLEEGSVDASRFERRARMFLVDNERGEEVLVLLDDARASLGRTAANGHVEGFVELETKDTRPRSYLDLYFKVVGERVMVHRRVPVLDPEGLAVVSDVDDTIKESNVLDKRALIKNTFVKEFEPVPGMASAYQKWREEGASFHYVSASPWQLLEELDAFRLRRGYPAGTFHLRTYRPKSISSNRELVGESKPHKIASIEMLLSELSGRRFVLVGDSGEHDPEVYGEIARKYGDRIHAIYVRRIEGADNSDERFARAFADVGATWKVFESADELEPTRK